MYYISLNISNLECCFGNIMFVAILRFAMNNIALNLLYFFTFITLILIYKIKNILKFSLYYGRVQKSQKKSENSCDFTKNSIYFLKTKIMQYKIPIQIENEDTIVLGLSLRQLGIMMAFGGIAYALFQFLESRIGGIALVPAIIVAGMGI